VASDRDVITITISRRAVRLFLLVVVAFLIIGFVVPLVLMNVGGGHGPDSVQGKPVPVRPQAVTISVSKSSR
jgi:K+-transporting ATPase c subunit